MDLAIFTEKHQPQPLAWQYHLSYVISVHYMYRFVSGPFNLIYFSILALKVHLVTGTLIITLDIWRSLLSLATSRFSYSWLLHFHMFQLLGLKKKKNKVLLGFGYAKSTDQFGPHHWFFYQWILFTSPFI